MDQAGRWHEALESVGLTGARLLRSSEDKEHCSGTADFAWSNIVLHFVDDRREVFLDISPLEIHAEPIRMDDLFVAMGWRSKEEAEARETPAEILGELRAVADRARQISEALSAENAPATIEAVQQVTAARQSAFLRKLERLADNFRSKNS